MNDKEPIENGDSFLYSVLGKPEVGIVTITNYKYEADVIAGKRYKDGVLIYIKKNRLVKRISKEKTPEYWL